MTRIDENTKVVGFGYIHGSNNQTMAFAISTIDELLIEIIPVGAPLSALAASRIHIDENTHQIGAGITDDANETITPLTVDEIVGLPCLRVELI